ADFPDSGADAPGASVPRPVNCSRQVGRFPLSPVLWRGPRGPARIGPVYRRTSRPPPPAGPRQLTLSPARPTPPRRPRFKEAAVKKSLFLPIFAVALASPLAAPAQSPPTTLPTASSATARATYVQPVQEYFIPFTDAPASLDYYNTPIG